MAAGKQQDDELEQDTDIDVIVVDCLYPSDDCFEENTGGIIELSEDGGTSQDEVIRGLDRSSDNLATGPRPKIKNWTHNPRKLSGNRKARELKQINSGWSNADKYYDKDRARVLRFNLESNEVFEIPNREDIPRECKNLTLKEDVLRNREEEKQIQEFIKGFQYERQHNLLSPRLLDILDSLKKWQDPDDMDLFLQEKLKSWS